MTFYDRNLLFTYINESQIGNWSRWLTDLFGMDDDDPPEAERDDDEDEGLNYNSSFKSFYLLKSLSDLMMLPKDLLLSESVRREVCYFTLFNKLWYSFNKALPSWESLFFQVCPAFGAQLIQRVLKFFVPDEFCSDPIPDGVFEALETEVSL